MKRKSRRTSSSESRQGLMRLEGLCSSTEAWLFYYGWSRVYDVMQPYFTSTEMREAGLDLAEVRGPLNVLDVGAGTGTLSKQVRARCGGGQLTLLDQSAQMLDQARAKPELAGCRFELCDATTGLPFEDDTFDCVVSSGSFYYFPEPIDALREQMRVVRPGGRVLVMGSLQPKPLLVRFLAQTLYAAATRHAPPVLIHVPRLLPRLCSNRFPTEEQYLEWFTAAGLADVQWKHVSNPWNAKQYAIAITGTFAADAPQPQRKKPPEATVARMQQLLYLPLALVRFGIALAAFCIVGPLQVPSRKPRRLHCCFYLEHEILSARAAHHRLRTLRRACAKCVARWRELSHWRRTGMWCGRLRACTVRRKPRDTARAPTAAPDARAGLPANPRIASRPCVPRGNCHVRSARSEEIRCDTIREPSQSGSKERSDCSTPVGRRGGAC